MSTPQHHTPAPASPPSPFDAHTIISTLRLTEQASMAKAQLTYPTLLLKSLLGGIFISLGAAFDLVIVGGSPGLRASNPALATLIGGLCFPLGFALITLLNAELCTSNMFVMTYGALRRRITAADVLKNLVLSYAGNIAGALLYARLLCYWADTLATPAQQAYAASQADARVLVNWGFNVSRGIMCNWLVGVAFLFATEARDFTGKIVAIWVPVTAFVALGYQHCVANYFLVPIGMMYGGTRFGVAAFVARSCVPVTIGNLVGGMGFGALGLWVVYGRFEGSVGEEGGKEAQGQGEGV